MTSVAVVNDFRGHRTMVFSVSPIPDVGRSVLRAINFLIHLVIQTRNWATSPDTSSSPVPTSLLEELRAVFGPQCDEAEKKKQSPQLPRQENHHQFTGMHTFILSKEQVIKDLCLGSIDELDPGGASWGFVRRTVKLNQ
ncbi:hypothetical protein E5288_WYG021021 [Bos mutus]|uniref:Uncharacterized protein n=1 Tax=Bos mutus TaxID=72004 RepID=A0A6B0SCS3_9CETA|nr:hypothetical protein [Bos mutus]